MTAAIMTLSLYSSLVSGVSSKFPGKIVAKRRDATGKLRQYTIYHVTLLLSIMQLNKPSFYTNLYKGWQTL